MTTGHTKQLLVSGDAGMGKSTVIDAAASGLTAAGVTVLRAAPAFAERFTAYSTLWDLVAALDWASFTDVPDEYRIFLDIAMGRRRATTDLPALATAVALEAVLAEMSASAPLALIIDDGQWADAESRLTIGRAFRRLEQLPVYLVVASRMSVASPGGALDLGFDAVDERVLDGLSIDELESVIRPTWPSTLTRTQVVALWEHTDGNPLWALELARRGGLSDLGARRVGSVDAPVSLAGAIAARLETLEVAVADVVSIVSLLGTAPLDLLQKVLVFAGIAPDAVSVAEAAGFLSITTTHVRTRHPLHAAAAAARLSPSRRRELHRFMAEAVDDTVVSAQHLQQSEPGGPHDRIARALTAAAAVMRSRGARLRSAHFLAQAVDRTDALSEHYPERLLDQAQQLFSAGDLIASMAALGSLPIARLTVSQFDAALALWTSSLLATRGRDVTAQFLESRREESRGDHARTAIVNAQLLGDDTTPVAARLEASVAAVTALGDIDAPNAVHRALRGQIIALLDGGDGLDQRLIDDCTRRQSVQIVVGLDDTGLATAGFLAHRIDDTDSSRRALDELVRWARMEGKDGVERVFLAHAALVEIIAGDVAAAGRFLRASGMGFDSTDLPPDVLPVIGLYLLAEGRHADALAFVARWERTGVGSGLFSALTAPALRGFSAAARGDFPVAVDHLRRAADHADALGLVEPGSRFRVDAPLIEALFRTGDADEARRRLTGLTLFLAERERPLSQFDALFLGSMRLASTGELNGALLAADDAVMTAASAFRYADEARARLQRARVLARLRKITRARRELDVATELATKSGLPDLLSDVTRTLASSRRAPSGSELTAAERRVHSAVVSGRSNREIAAELFVSVRTVESHVSAILRKTGASSRARLRTPQ